MLCRPSRLAVPRSNSGRSKRSSPAATDSQPSTTAISSLTTRTRSSSAFVRNFFAPGQTTPKPDDWGAIGVWAWGLSRALDYLVTDPLIDPTRIAVTGHSRLGKTVNWAAAQDTRFAAILSTESGKAGQSLSRRVFGETVAHLEDSFPYWFCANYAQWSGRDTEIPADGNLLLSLLAPRPVYVASAEGDQWSDPRGEFLSAVSASHVYALLGEPGISTQTMPPADTPTDPTRFVAYHVRTGKHDVTAYDWDQYLNFLDAHFGKQVAPSLYSAAPAAVKSDPIHVSGGVMAGRILSKEQPMIPYIPPNAHIAGAVVLHAIIDRKGHITTLSVISGPDALREPVREAVSKWTYQPYLLNGEPVDVDTTITVNH